jgi:predicted GNAT family acetyltransferase
VDRLFTLSIETPPSEQGKGLAGVLTKQTFDYCVEKKLKILPTCPYLSAYVQKHPEYQSIVAK